MAEKKKPTYDLEAFKADFGAPDSLNVTGGAIRSAAALGFGRAEIAATIQAMGREHFYKSMTSYADHRVWQDVYFVPSEVGTLYIKFTANLLLSFEQRDND
jgi:motility quorum-sensing regulator / GCU-specific mRNA interferase toxin